MHTMNRFLRSSLSITRPIALFGATACLAPACDSDPDAGTDAGAPVGGEAGGGAAAGGTEPGAGGESGADGTESGAGGAGGESGDGLLAIVAACASQSVAGLCSCTTWYLAPPMPPNMKAILDGGCVESGGMPVEVCSGDNAIGQCEQSDGTFIIHRFYFQDGDTCPGGAADWQAMCTATGGEWQ